MLGCAAAYSFQILLIDYYSEKTDPIRLAFIITLQIVGQKYTPPALAAIIMSMESVFAALCGGIFLHEVMTGNCTGSKAC